MPELWKEQPLVEGGALVLDASSRNLRMEGNIRIFGLGISAAGKVCGVKCSLIPVRGGLEKWSLFSERPVRYPTAFLSGNAYMSGMVTNGPGAAHGVNASGTSVGWIFDEDSPPAAGMPKAVYWTAKHVAVPLARPKDAVGGAAFAIAESGRIAGTVAYPRAGSDLPRWRAVVWERHAMKELLEPAQAVRSLALALNEKGTVAGVVWLPLQAGPEEASATVRACRWTPEGLVHLLPAQANGRSMALALNAAGDAVGWAGGEGERHAVLWKGEDPCDLNGLVDGSTGLQLLQASAINDRGWIAGVGRTTGGRLTGFLLKPLGP
jgi:uncharacterized membrane protein